MSAIAHRPSPIDKENAPPSLSISDIDALSTSLLTSGTSLAAYNINNNRRKKPTSLGILGIGRAPKASYRRHSAKPYGRVTSVQRAKKANNKIKGKSKDKKISLKPTISTGVKMSLMDEMTRELIRERERITKRLRHERWKKSLYIPSNSLKRKKFSIPYKLPLPTFPAIPPLDHDGLREKPIEYLSKLLTKHLPNIEKLTLAHKPHINVDSLRTPDSQYAAATNADVSIPIPPRMALALPGVVQGETTEQFDSVLFKPDVCLVIMGRDDPQSSTLDGKILVPAMSMVLATQCAYWQELSQKSSNLIPITNTPSPVGSATPVNSPTPSETELDEVDADITPTAESFEVNVKDVDAVSTAESVSSSDSDTDSVSDADTASDSDSGSEAEELPPSMVFARVVPIILPSPKTYETVHQHLHHPERSFLHDLLDIPQTLRTRGEVLGAIKDRSVQECMDRLEVIQGVWQNLCVLGKVGGRTWEHVGGAWAYTLGVITGYGVLGKHQQSAQGVVGPTKTFAEWVAKEWASRAKATDAAMIVEALKVKRAELEQSEKERESGKHGGAVEQKSKK